jgi:hypothetical protein
MEAIIIFASDCWPETPFNSTRRIPLNETEHTKNMLQKDSASALGDCVGLTLEQLTFARIVGQAIARRRKILDNPLPPKQETEPIIGLTEPFSGL